MATTKKPASRKRAGPQFPIPLAEFGDIIRAVTTPLGLTVLVVLFVGCIAGLAVATGTIDPLSMQTLIVGSLVVFSLLVGIVFLTAWLKPGVVTPTVQPIDTGDDSETLLSKNSGVLHFKDGPPEPDAWSKELLPVLHQAMTYTVPTYFLDTKLRIIDWNIAFELLFAQSVGKLRGKHVNYFIIELENREQVFDHAQEFTHKVEQGQLPLVDSEVLQFASPEFCGRVGIASFLKLAVQLHDTAGTHRGWSVALLPQDINWQEFQRRLEPKLLDDKLWSVYSASYDRVLTAFPPYRQLLADVTSVVPDSAHKVVDLGAGTGNATKELIARGHRVTAVENNQSMLDKLREKHFSSAQVSIVKGSVERLELLADESYDAAVMVNVLYAVDDPLACLASICRILKPGGVLGFSTTHAQTKLGPLLASIKADVQSRKNHRELAEDYQALEEANRHLEVTITSRWSREQYRQWVEQAGFEIIHEIPSTYEGAVTVIHARKR